LGENTIATSFFQYYMMHKLSILSSSFAAIIGKSDWSKPLRRIAIIGMSLPLAITPTLVHALPEAQIVTKLQKTPVFTITNQTGNFLQQSTGTGANSRLATPVFMELKDAVIFLKKVKKEQPQNSKVAQITIVPLSEVYKLQVEAKKKSANMSFVFVPAMQQLKNALAIEKKTYKPNTPYLVPLFVIAIEQKNQFVTIQRNNVTSLFFDKTEAQQSLNLFKKTDTKLSAKAKIKVYYLQNVLDDFAARDYAGQDQLALVPSPESRESIRKLQAAQSKAASTPTTSTPKK
jgi:Tic22-like family